MCPCIGLWVLCNTADTKPCCTCSRSAQAGWSDMLSEEVLSQTVLHKRSVGRFKLKDFVVHCTSIKSCVTDGSNWLITSRRTRKASDSSYRRGLQQTLPTIAANKSSKHAAWSGRAESRLKSHRQARCLALILPGIGETLIWVGCSWYRGSAWTTLAYDWPSRRGACCSSSRTALGRWRRGGVCR